MARDFTKNTSNRLSIGQNVVGTLANGQSSVCVSCLVLFDSFEASGVGTDDVWAFVFGIVPVWFGIQINHTSGNHLTVVARATTGDTIQVATGSTSLSTGTWYHLLAVVDFANGDLFLYLDGVLEASNTSCTFGSTTFTQSATSFGRDAIGWSGGDSAGTTRHLDGAVAEFAVWIGVVMGASDALQLATKASPLLVRTPSLYWELLGDADAGPVYDRMRRQGATIAGTVAKRDHPAGVTYGHRRAARGTVPAPAPVHPPPWLPRLWRSGDVLGRSHRRVAAL